MALANGDVICYPSGSSWSTGEGLVKSIKGAIVSKTYSFPPSFFLITFSQRTLTSLQVQRSFPAQYIIDPHPGLP